LEPDPHPSPQEYDLKPDPVEQIPQPPTEPKPRPLNYRSARYEDARRQGPGRAVECAAGFFAYIGVIAAIYFLVANIGFGSHGILAMIPLLALGGLAIYLQGYRGWRGFVPGVLLGLGLSCLIGAGGVIWIVVTCSHQ
jgi:hypothetical protein